MTTPNAQSMRNALAEAIAANELPGPAEPRTTEPTLTREQARFVGDLAWRCGLGPADLWTATTPRHLLDGEGNLDPQKLATAIVRAAQTKITSK
ncbi:hypothetical protein AS25_03150 [Kocuria marina]|uniref:Uncharacterized protein n=1 Tax=Kocuria marina TaxID=223184 RepID=A0A0B0DF83_9MICC|nr:hypothetical protein [Kocuria marina]KHE74832.1 hypothetical protein AS25_03150 [Kocuria marina]